MDQLAQLASTPQSANAMAAAALSISIASSFYLSSKINALADDLTDIAESVSRLNGIVDVETNKKIANIQRDLHKALKKLQATEAHIHKDSLNSDFTYRRVTSRNADTFILPDQEEEPVAEDELASMGLQVQSA